MASTIDRIKKDIIEAINASQRTTTPYDTEAEIVRVDGNVAWVHIPGGATETPVALTINARKGDKVQVRVSNGGAWLMGNATAPPTDDAKANEADKKAAEAKYLAVDAVDAALKADIAAQDAVLSAETARTAAETAQEIAEGVEGIAEQAQQSASNASEYAARALGNLSTVQNVTETLNWITQHGTMTLTTDVALDPTHVYFIVDENGDYTVNGTTYSIVTEPNVENIENYYVLSIDESLNNYIASHLALTDAGLDLWRTTGQGDDYRLHQGVVYADPSKSLPFGVYILTSDNRPIAQFTLGKMQLGLNDAGHITITSDQNGNKIEFFENAETTVASITNSEMNIERTVVIQSMKVGNWQWTAMPSGNLRLQWVGE